MRENQQYFFRIFQNIFLEAKAFFIFKISDVLTKIGYFNIDFVSLQYKNTTQY